MVFTREGIYDMIIGSGALSYSWYEAVNVVMPPNGEDPWLVLLEMEDPDGEDFIDVKVTCAEIIAAAVRLIDDTGFSNWGTSAKLGASRWVRRQAALLYNDDDTVDFDASTADELLQVVAYGKVIFC